MTEEAFLQAILDDPASAAATWLVLADWLEERNDPRTELVRLCHDPNFPTDLTPVQCDDRVRALLASGIKPCVPTITNSIGMRLALIPAGTFLMGSPETEERRQRMEGPRHEVTITRPYLLGIYPVTQAEYRKVMGKNPSYFSSRGGGRQQVKGLKTATFPAEQLSWEDAVDFCDKLSALPSERASGRSYRLPSEAEWERACRVGAVVSVPFHVGGSLTSQQANFNGDFPYGSADRGPHLGRTCAVGSYPPNAFGLYDLHGNVWEWCADIYEEDFYDMEMKRDPVKIKPKGAVRRVLRGGSWGNGAGSCRAAHRYGDGPADHDINYGFRVSLHLD
jgi:uncharacterized protein (TIGR02996 family)